MKFRSSLIPGKFKRKTISRGSFRRAWQIDLVCLVDLTSKSNDGWTSPDETNKVFGFQMRRKIYEERMRRGRERISIIGEIWTIQFPRVGHMDVALRHRLFRGRELDALSNIESGPAERVRRSRSSNDKRFHVCCHSIAIVRTLMANGSRECLTRICE